MLVTLSILQAKAKRSTHERLYVEVCDGLKSYFNQVAITRTHARSHKHTHTHTARAAVPPPPPTHTHDHRSCAI